MSPRSLLVPALSAVLTLSAPVWAQPYTQRSFLVPEGAFELTGEPSRPQILRISLSDESAFEPIHLAPHFYWGVSEKVTLGITHREGLCLNACGGRPYKDAGFGLLLGLVQSGDFELDLNAGVQIRNFDPFFLGLKGGVIGRLTFSSVAFVFDPTLYVGMSEREAGNREQLVLPFWFYFQASPSVVPFVGAMLVGPLEGFLDNLAVPVEGGVIFEVSQDVDLGAYFRFDNLLGRGGSTAWREAGMLGRFRF